MSLYVKAACKGQVLFPVYTAQMQAIFLTKSELMLIESEMLPHLKLMMHSVLAN